MGQCNEFCAFLLFIIRKNIFPAKTHFNASASPRCHTGFVSYEEASPFGMGTRRHGVRTLRDFTSLVCNLPDRTVLYIG